jgi:hypothetical protein
MYTHGTNNVITIEDLKNVDDQGINFKPKGFWYANENDWIQWAGENMGILDYKYFFEVKVHHTKLANPDKNKILYLETIEDMIEFSIRFKSSINIYHRDDKYICDIDWGKVAKLYGGVEIKFSKTYRLTGEYTLVWASTFDVHSGCIWNMEAIESMVPIEPIKFVDYREDN